MKIISPNKCNCDDYENFARENKYCVHCSNSIVADDDKLYCKVKEYRTWNDSTCEEFARQR